MIAVLQLVAMFLVPALILRRRNGPLTRLAGPIGTAYLLGFAVALVIWLLGLAGVNLTLNADVGQIGSYVAIGIAIPLLLFGSNLAQIRRLTKPVLFSFASLTLSVVLTALAVSWLFARSFDGGRALCAMSTGLYTGGTPNFSAIGVILGVSADLIALGNLSDMLIGGIFYVFILLAAGPLLRRLLGTSQAAYLTGGGAAVNMDQIGGRWNRGLLRNLALAFLIAALGAGIGVGFWVLGGSVQGSLTNYLVPAVMITGTVLGIALSFLRPVREVKENTTAGQYLILVFSFALASSLDLSQLGADFGKIFLTLALITLVSSVLHVCLCRLLGIDGDCALVTMTAGLYGPAFVPAVTRQLKNDALTAPGLICGALGYAVGTFLGVALYYIL